MDELKNIEQESQALDDENLLKSIITGGSEAQDEAFLQSLVKEGQSPPQAIPAPPEPEVSPDDVHQGQSPSFWDDAADIGQGILHGGIDAVNETLEFGQTVGAMHHDTVFNNTVGAVIPQLKQDYSKRIVEEIIPNVPEPTTTGGKIADGLSQFLTGFVGAGKFMKAGQGANLLVKGGVAAAKGAVVDFTVFDGQEERLSNLVNQFPSLRNPITEFLAADENDNEVVGRLKNVLEGIALGLGTDAAFAGAKALKNPKAITEGFMNALGNMKQVRKLISEGMTDDAARVLSEGSDLIEETISKDADEVLDELTGLKPIDTDASDGTISASITNTAVIDEAPPVIKEFSETEQLKETINSALKAGKDIDDIPFSTPLNLDRISTTDEALTTLDSIYKIAKEEIDNFRGPKETLQSLNEKSSQLLEGEVEEFAATFETNKDGFMTQLLQDKNNLADARLRLAIGRKMMTSLAKRVSDVAVRMDLGATDDVTKAEFEKFAGLLVNLNKAVLGSSSEFGRGLSSLRMIADDSIKPEQIATLLSDPEAVEKIARYTRMVEDPNALVKMLRFVSKHGADTINEYVINNILSGPKTHLINMVSTATNSVISPSVRGIGALLTGQRDVMEDAVVQYAGLFRSLQDSFALAGKTLLTEEPILKALPSSVDAPAKVISAEGYGLEKGTIGTAVDWLGRAIRIPSRLLLGEDEFFLQANYRSEVYAKALREAREQGEKDIFKYAEDKLQASFDPQGRALDKDGIEYAEEMTFTRDLDDSTLITRFGNTFSEGVARHPIIGRQVMPFIRVPTNIIQRFVEFGPASPLQKKFYQDFSKGGTKRADAVGKLATGSALWTYAGMMASQNKITGSGPKDPELKKQWALDGRQPYSMNIGTPENPQWVAYNRIDPFGMFFGLAADFAQVSGDSQPGQLDEMAADMVVALASNLSSKSYLQGLIDTVSTLARENHSPSESAKRLLASKLSGFVPGGSFLNTARQFGDDYLRETRGMMDQVLNRIPGYSETLEPKVDVLGEPILAPSGYNLNEINPFAYSRTVSDPVRKELARMADLGASFSPNPDFLNDGRIDLTLFKNSEGQSAAYRFKRLNALFSPDGSTTLASQLKDMIQSDAYKNAPDGTDDYDGGRVLLLRKVFGKYREAVKKQLLNEDFKSSDGRTLLEVYQDDFANQRKARSQELIEEITPLPTE